MSIWKILKFCLAYGWRSSVSLANGWATVGGGTIVYLSMQYLYGGDENLPGGMKGFLELALTCLAAAWIVIFLGRLVFAPIVIIRQQSSLLKKLQVTLPIGSLHYVTSTSTVKRKISTDENSVELSVDLKNNTDGLMRFDALLQASANRTYPTRNPLRLVGLIYARQSIRLVADTIYNVQYSREVDIKNPNIRCTLTYQVTYWLDVPMSERRYSTKTLNWSIYDAINSDAPTQSAISLTSLFSNELEK